MLDKVDESMDRKLAQHLVGLYLEDAPDTGGQDILVSINNFLSSSERGSKVIP